MHYEECFTFTKSKDPKLYYPILGVATDIICRAVNSMSL